MKPVILAAAILACSVQLASATEVASRQEGASAPEADIEDGNENEAGVVSPDIATFCFVAGNPPSGRAYSVIRRLKVGKGTYGGIRDILPQLASSAKRRGADALIGYDGSQRFGFFPWRMVRPVVRGTAVRWTGSKPESCAAVGGSTLQEILDSGLPPGAVNADPGAKEGS